jgi:hypothetical protein
MFNKIVLMVIMTCSLFTMFIVAFNNSSIRDLKNNSMSKYASEHPSYLNFRSDNRYKNYHTPQPNPNQQTQPDPNQQTQRELKSEPKPRYLSLIHI